jgi:hypothetical protein
LFIISYKVSYNEIVVYNRIDPEMGSQSVRERERATEFETFREAFAIAKKDYDEVVASVERPDGIHPLTMEHRIEDDYGVVYEFN